VIITRWRSHPQTHDFFSVEPTVEFLCRSVIHTRPSHAYTAGYHTMNSDDGPVAVGVVSLSQADSIDLPEDAELRDVFVKYGLNPHLPVLTALICLHWAAA
jgi:hypothetical protein